jgi:hypothetical protein
MTTPLLYLRAVQLGLSIADTDALELGFLYDMFAENGNDDIKYDYVATQEDFDRF